MRKQGLPLARARFGVFSLLTFSIGKEIIGEIESKIRKKSRIIRFVREMEHVERLACEKVRFRGLVNLFRQAIPFLAYAVALYCGGMMVTNDEIHYKNLVRYVVC